MDSSYNTNVLDHFGCTKFIVRHTDMEESCHLLCKRRVGEDLDQALHPNEQRRFTEGKIPLYPPFPKWEDLNSLLCKRRSWEDFKELFIPSITPSQNGVCNSQ